jgi:hypothetical protein
MRWAQVVKAASTRPEYSGVRADSTVRQYREQVRKWAKKGEPVSVWLDAIASRLEVKL